MLQDLLAEQHEHPVHRQRSVALCLADGALHEVPVARVLGGGEQERRIGGRVLRLPARDLLDVAGVGDDQRMPTELFELGVLMIGVYLFAAGWVWALVSSIGILLDANPSTARKK